MWNLWEWRYRVQEGRQNFIWRGVRKAAQGKRNDAVLQFDVTKNPFEILMLMPLATGMVIMSRPWLGMNLCNLT